MARQPTLTINVNSAQFQQFTRNFNAFSGQIRNLNGQFNQINASLQRSNILVRGVQASMTGLLNTTKSLGSEVLKITKHFVSWSTIIGGITALLGMGGGLFGIERLAASILAKRRLVLGLGGDYGRTQASMIFSQGLLGSPQSALQNVQMGLKGSPDQMTALLSMGIPFGSKMQPDEVLDKYMEKLAGILSRAKPGTELMIAHAYGADKILGMDDLIRLTTEEGRKELEMKRQLVKEYAPLLQITPKAQRAWMELEMQFQAAKAQIESVFGNVLADLAKPLKDLSDAFAHLVRIIMESPVIQRLIKDLGNWIEKLATQMKGLTERDINDFIEKIKGWLPTMEEFKTAMHDFVEILKGAVEVMKFLAHPVDYFKQNILPRAYEPAEQSGPSGPPATPGGATPSSIAKDVGDWLKRPMFGGAQAPSGPSAPATAASTWGAGITPFNKFGGFGGGLGGGPMSQTAPGAAGFSWLNSVTGGATAGAWSGAAGKMVPQGGFSGRFGDWTGSSDTPQKGGSRPGPLSMNNWQMNRTANLVVRNVPGANIFMSAAGMTG
jgi:hypothetical protein